MNPLKITAIGNSLGIILPKEALQRLRVGRGDQLFLVETQDGYEMTPYDPEFAMQVEAGQQIMREDRDALRKLAE